MPDISSHETQTAHRRHEHPRQLDVGPIHVGSVSPARAPGHALGWKSEVRQTAIVDAELQLAYDTFNAELFDNSLADCLLTLQRKDRTMGYFSAGRFGNRSKERLHEIAMNPAYLRSSPWSRSWGPWFMRCATCGSISTALQRAAATTTRNGEIRWRRLA
ncbi:hypothetical protein [Massilia scottii]|uniref:hypothetical protein n=1 Tax=Massilia scottii TaxID=3057166 RepID=UPI0027BA46A9|nr:hypothetical protein [Massilia sp. CCM 9029]